MANKVKVIISDEQKAVKIPKGLRMLIRRCCTAVLTMENFKGDVEIGVRLVDNEEIRKLNKKHRNLDEETDVLSFPLGENGVYDVNHDTGEQMLGDIVISVEKAFEQADKYGHSIEREIGYLVVHSMLHLLGYDHEKTLDAEKIMRSEEKRILTAIGIGRG